MNKSVNFGFTTLASSINAAQITASLSADILPTLNTGEQCRIILGNPNSDDCEICIVTEFSGTSITQMSRGEETDLGGSLATSWGSGTLVTIALTAEMWNVINDSFVAADLSSNILTITHPYGTKLVTTQIWDHDGYEIKMITPQSISVTQVQVDLSLFSSDLGSNTWYYAVKR